MITVTLEDQGQDFLEWNIENGVVVGCRPFQEGVWKGTRVLNEKIEPGDVLWLWLKGAKSPTTLNYRVEEVVAV